MSDLNNSNTHQLVYKKCVDQSFEQRTFDAWSSSSVAGMVDKLLNPR